MSRKKKRTKEGGVLVFLEGGIERNSRATQKGRHELLRQERKSSKRSDPLSRQKERKRRGKKGTIRESCGKNGDLFPPMSGQLRKARIRTKSAKTNAVKKRESR